MLLLIVILVMASIGVMLLVRYPFGDIGSSGSGNSDRDDQQQARPLANARDSQFLTVFVYGEGGEMAAYMVGGQTDEFGSFREAITGAEQAAGEKDESYSDLLVFSFTDGSTMEIAYSPSANAISYEGNLFNLPVELQPMIRAVEERFNE